MCSSAAGVTQIGPLFLASVRQSVYHRSLALSTRHLDIQYTPLGGQAGVIGAGALAMQETLQLHGAGGMSLAVEFRDVVKNFGPVQVLHGVSFALDARPRLRPARRERRGQVHADEDPRGLRATQRRRDCAWTAGRRASRFARSRGAGHRADPPGVQPGRRPDASRRTSSSATRRRRGWLLDDAAMRAEHARRAAPGRPGRQSRHAACAT